MSAAVFKPFMPARVLSCKDASTTCHRPQAGVVNKRFGTADPVILSARLRLLACTPLLNAADSCICQVRPKV